MKYYLIIFFLLLMALMPFASSYGDVQIVSNMTRGKYITWFDDYFINCVDCSGNGITHGIAKYDRITDTYYDYSAIQEGGYIINTSYGTCGEAIPKNVNSIFISSSYSLYIEELPRWGCQTIFPIYRYNYATNKWSFVTNMTPFSKYTGMANMDSAFKGQYNI